MNEIGLAQKFINLFILMGGMYVVFYYLIYGTLWLGGGVNPDAKNPFENI